MTIAFPEILEAFKALLSVAAAIGGPFLTWWLARERAERQEVTATAKALGSDLAELRLDIARNYARREEIKDSRQEVLDAVDRLSTKVDRIYDKLDNKADKT
ncbi:hypothetical protein DFLDMN_001052 [Cupriavidus sp. H19C3]|uniref:hypothetical protein n=1 Tax=Cupriavidus sp. H19C3 TaxID=3241603 RepID=UPI003BF89BEA